MFLIWIKIPKHHALGLNEIANFTLSYSPIQLNIPRNSEIRMKVSNQPYPLYYFLQTPTNFDFKKTKFTYIDNQGNIKESENELDHVSMYKNYYGLSVRVKQELDHDFILSYSFKPERQSSHLIKTGAVVLSIISVFTMLHVFNLIIILEDSSFLDKNLEIGLFVVAASLVLPQLTTNNAIRMKLYVYYLIPLILGGFLAFAR